MTNSPGRYRQKYYEIDAMQWDGTPEGASPIIDWVLSQDRTARWNEERTTDTSTNVDTGETVVSQRKVPLPPHVAVDISDGTTIKAFTGDWVVWLESDFAICTDEIFTEAFEQVPA